MVSVIASRYASALVDVVTAPGAKVEGTAAIQQLRDIEAAVNASSQLRGILQNPAISRTRKRAVIGRIAKRLRSHRRSGIFFLWPQTAVVSVN